MLRMLIGAFVGALFFIPTDVNTGVIAPTVVGAIDMYTAQTFEYGHKEWCAGKLHEYLASRANVAEVVTIEDVYWANSELMLRACPYLDPARFMHQ